MPAPRTHDYFAELYVAGRLADAGWNVYFPHRDKGFDFIISKSVTRGGPIIRPVQVKGKYPTDEKGDRNAYGFIGSLSETHSTMILAIAYFGRRSPTDPVCVAYMPLTSFKLNRRGIRCQPASYKDGIPKPRREFAKFFDGSGIALLDTQA